MDNNLANNPCPDKAELFNLLLRCLLCCGFAQETTGCVNSSKQSKERCIKPQKLIPLRQKEIRKKTQVELSEENKKYLQVRALAEGCSMNVILNEILDAERQRTKLSQIIKRNE